MSAADLELTIAAGAHEWEPEDPSDPRFLAPAIFECIACGTRVPLHQVRRALSSDGRRCLVCQACNAHELVRAAAPGSALADAEARALDASEAPAPRPAALIAALAAMLQAFPEARNFDQERARRMGLDALDALAGFAQPAHVVELARAVDRLEQCRDARDVGRGDTDALQDARAWVQVAARRLVRGVDGGAS